MSKAQAGSLKDGLKREGFMTNRIKGYLNYVDELLLRDDLDFEEESKKHLVQIQFFAHERLVHLIVMALFTVLTMACCLVFICTEKIQVLILAVALMVLLVPYIKHYFLLENGVQNMYVQYDKMLEKAGKEAYKG